MTIPEIHICEVLFYITVVMIMITGDFNDNSRNTFYWGMGWLIYRKCRSEGRK